MVWHLLFLSSHLSLLHVKSKLLPQYLFIYSLEAILNECLPIECFFITKHPKKQLCHGVTSVQIFNLSYKLFMGKKLNEVQCFMILISFYNIKAALKKLSFMSHHVISLFWKRYSWIKLYFFTIKASTTVLYKPNNILKRKRIHFFVLLWFKWQKLNILF